MLTPSFSLQSVWSVSSTESSESVCSVLSTSSSVGSVVKVRIMDESSFPDSELVGHCQRRKHAVEVTLINVWQVIREHSPLIVDSGRGRLRGGAVRGSGRLSTTSNWSGLTLYMYVVSNSSIVRSGLAR